MNEPRMRSAKNLKKSADLDDEYTIIAIDQTCQELTTDLIHAWFPEEERPTLSVSGAREGLKLLGGVTVGGDTFFLKCEDNFPADITTRLLDALQTEFGEKICVIPDNAPYFAANDVHDYVDETPIELCHLPRGSLNLNPAEECWQKLNQRLGNQLFKELDELREAVFEALASIEPPNVYNHLCP